MASARERRAALQKRGTVTHDGAIAIDAGFITPVEYVDREELRARYALPSTEPPEEPAMKVQFSSVLLDKEIPRFGDKGFASSSTTSFRANDGVTIELDTAMGVLWLSKGSLVVGIPREKVASYGPVLEPVAASK